MWMEDWRSAMDYHEFSGRNPFIDKVARTRNFNSRVRSLESVGDHCGNFQDLERRGMKRGPA